MFSLYNFSLLFKPLITLQNSLTHNIARQADALLSIIQMNLRLRKISVPKIAWLTNGAVLLEP